MKFLPNAFIIFGFGGFFFKLRPCPKPCPVSPPAFTHTVPFRARAAIFGTVDHPVSDPMTDDQVTKLKICTTSAFKHPTNYWLWADMYFPGMTALIKWFSLFFDLKRERSLHLEVLKTLAQTVSVKREIEELQRVLIYFENFENFSKYPRVFCVFRSIY